MSRRAATRAADDAASWIGRFFFIEIDPFALGLFRAALALYVLLFYLMLLPSWTFYYGPGGIAPFQSQDLSTYRPLSPILWFVRSNAVLWALYAVSAASAVLLFLGIRWRLALVWLWHMNLTLLYGNPYAVNGEEQVMSVLFVFSFFLPLGESLTWSQLASRPGRRAMLAADAKVRTWPLRALQIHIALVYLASLPDKLADSAWRDGTLVYYAMMGTDYTRWPGLDLFAWGNAALSRLLTAVSLAVELLFPLLVWFRRYRFACALAAMALHAGMGVLLEGVMMFNAAMIVALILFLPSRRTRTWLAERLGAGRLAPDRGSAAVTSGAAGGRRRRSGSTRAAGIRRRAR